MLQLALAIAPGIAIMVFIYIKDQYEKEPLKNLVFSFLLGVLSIIPAVIIQLSLEPVVKQYGPSGSLLSHPFISNAILAYAIVGLSEEGSKFLMLRVYAYRKKAFNEPFDGIVYSVMVSMGFATLENIGYVVQGGLATALLRMFLSVPAHGSFAVIMGYHAGLAKFDSRHAAARLWKGLLLAVFFHGTFDYFLFLKENQTVTQSVSGGLLFGGAVLSYYFAIRLSLKSIRMHRELSRQGYKG